MNIGTPTAVTDYAAQYDADTLGRAAEIKADPDRLSKAKACAAAKLRNLKAVAGEEGDSEVPTSAESSLQKGYRAVK